MFFKKDWFYKERVFTLSITVFCLCFVALLGLEAWHSRTREINLAQRYLEAYAQTLENHARTSIEKIDVALRNVQNNYRTWLKQGLDAEEITEKLNALLGSIPESQSLRIVDADGNFIFDANGVLSGNIAEQAYFQKNKTDTSGGLIISEPIITQLTGRWAITLTRRLETDQGAFAGVVQAGVPRQFFEDFYKNTLLGTESVVAIFDTDTRLLGRFPPLQDMIGQPLQDLNIKPLLQQADSGVYRGRSPLDGIDRIFAFRRVEGMPLAVMVGLPIDIALAEWKRTVITFFINTALLLFLLFGFIMIWAKNFSLIVKGVKYRERYDELTDLPNIKSLHEHFNKNIKNTKGAEAKAAVFVLNVDDFKHVNETLGRSAGDKFLQIIAQRFTEIIFFPNMVSRHTGDEFVFLLPNAGDADSISLVAEEILELVGKAVELKGQVIVSTASIGISVYPDDGDDIAHLVENAEAAMYHAKNAHTSEYRFFSKEMNEQIAEQIWMETALRNALERKELELHYQPQFNMEDRRLIGFEALLRWHHPERGNIPPDLFITAAETAKLILPIGEWILYEACRQRKEWLDMGVTDICVAVNLSAVQFRDPGLCRLIINTLETTGLPAQFLELEITESVAMDKTDKVIALLMQLQEIGVKTSIDDFGTGYSSLSYLKQFPLNKLKIDKAFVQDIVSDRDSAAIVEAILSMGRKLGLTCIAEGVETQEQATILHSYGSHEIQGYLAGRPVPAAKATEYLLSRKWSSDAISW